ncbi:MAG: DNA polymerase IV [Fibrobacterota bacterium]
MPENTQPLIIHVDMDAFFASVEQRDDPRLRGKPVIVGARPGTRGVVAAASYEARRFGVHSAMPIHRASALCPHAYFITPRRGRYTEDSARIMAVLRDFSPRCEPLSVDEAFLDMSGCERIMGSPRDIAQSIQAQLYDACALTASVGAAPNKLLAKIASDMNKPAGITCTPFAPKAVLSWLASRDISLLWGIGEKAADRLRSRGIFTIGDIQRQSAAFMRGLFGTRGEQLYAFACGRDDRPVEGRTQRKSIGREKTFQNDTTSQERVQRTLLGLAEDVARKARSEKCAGRRLSLVTRNGEFQRRSFSVTLAAPTNSTYDLYNPLCRLVEKYWATIIPVRLIGLSFSGFDESCQLSLFGGSRGKTQESWKRSDAAVDIISRRTGLSLQRGASVQKRSAAQALFHERT